MDRMIGSRGAGTGRFRTCGYHCHGCLLQRGKVPAYNASDFANPS